MTPIEKIRAEYETARVFLHHAYLIEGSEETILPILCDFFENTCGITIRGNPDVFIRKYEVFGISDSREIIDRATQKAIGKEACRIFVLCALNMTHEAQNALLKLFEEPAQGTHFFLIIPHTSMLLRTLLSRMSLLGTEERNRHMETARHFLSATAAKRLKIVEVLIQEKDTARARVLCEDIEALLYTRARENGELGTLRTALLPVEQCREYLSDRSPSVKMLLEYLSVTLPRIEV